MTELKSIYLLVKLSSAKISYVASLRNHYQSWKRRLFAQWKHDHNDNMETFCRYLYPSGATIPLVRCPPQFPNSNTLEVPTSSPTGCFASNSCFISGSELLPVSFIIGSVATGLSCRAGLRFNNKIIPITIAQSRRTLAETPTPIPAFTPVLNPLFAEFVGPADVVTAAADVAEGDEDNVDDWL